MSLTETVIKRWYETEHHQAMKRHEVKEKMKRKKKWMNGGKKVLYNDNCVKSKIYAQVNGNRISALIPKMLNQWNCFDWIFGHGWESKTTGKSHSRNITHTQVVVLINESYLNKFKRLIYENCFFLSVAC